MARQVPAILPAGWQENDRYYLRRTLEEDNEMWSDDENFVVRDSRPTRNRLRPDLAEANGGQAAEAGPQMEDLQIIEDDQPAPEANPVPERADPPPPEEPRREYPFGICTICTEAPVDQCLFPCGHTNICGTCVHRWMQEGYNTCPTCIRYMLPIKIYN